jgi:tetratricopeptide (TPR) repeat protein
MRSISQNRTFNRALFFALIALLIILVSWRLAPERSTSQLSSFIDSFSSNASSRASASTDAQIKRLQEQLRSHPDNVQAYTQLGLLYLQKARETGDPTYYQKTEAVLNKALSSQPDDYTSVAVSGALALARHQFHEALTLGEKARQINPDRTYAYGVIADSQIELGQYSEAVDTLQEMVDLRPDMSSYSRISYIRELHGDFEGSMEMMQRAVDSGTPNLESTAWVRTQLGNLYFNTGDLQGAEAEYQRTLQDRPNYVYAIAGLGRVQAAQGDTEAAIKSLEKAVAIMPMPEFVIALGDLYQTSGQQAKADQQYKLVATIEKLYRANGVDMDMEIALFNADHNINLPETLVLAQKAYANRPSIHGADALAWALYKTGNYQEAHKYSLEALKLGTKDALKLFHAGMIALKLGNDTNARDYLEQALAINPHFSISYADEARKTLQMLKY